MVFQRQLLFLAVTALCASSAHGYLPQLTDDLPDVIDEVKSSVVTVYAFSDKLGRGSTLGTGWVYDGFVVTNFHVVENASRVVVQRQDGERFDAIGIVGHDARNDVAIVAIDFRDEVPPALRLADDVPRVGERVFVIGNPRGLELSVSDGIVSAIRTYAEVDVIQITAPISPGSSGSPVFIADGSVVGVATFVRRDGQALNFAIPVHAVSATEFGQLIDFAQWAAREQRPATGFGDNDFASWYDFWYEQYKRARPDPNSERPALQFSARGRNIGHLDGWYYRILQVLGDDIALVTEYSKPQQLQWHTSIPSQAIRHFRVRGINVRDSVDGDAFDFPWNTIFVRTGTYSYTAASGAMTTVHDVESLCPAEFEAAGARRLQRQREEANAIAVQMRDLSIEIEQAMEELSAFQEEHSRVARYIRLNSDIQLYEKVQHIDRILEQVREWQTELASIGEVSQEEVQTYEDGVKMRRESITALRTARSRLQLQLQQTFSQ